MVGERSTPRPCRFTPGNDPVPTVQEVGWTQGPVWTGSENLAPQRDKIPGPYNLQRVNTPITLPRPGGSHILGKSATPNTPSSKLSAILFFATSDLSHLTEICSQFYFLELPNSHTWQRFVRNFIFRNLRHRYTWQRTVCNFIVRNVGWINLQAWKICVRRV